MQNTAQTLAKLFPAAQYQTLPEQEHNVNLAVIAPIMKEFFK
jgi:hypothetical protein